MSLDAQLSYLTVDLGILRCTEAQETYLRGILTQAADFIATRGIVLQPDCDADDMLAAMVAGWLYKARANSDEKELPTYLRRMLNSKLMQQKAGGAQNDL